MNKRHYFKCEDTIEYFNTSVMNKGKAVTKVRSNNWTKSNPDAAISNQCIIAKNNNSKKIDNLEKQMQMIREQVNSNFINIHDN
jgi:hypothetical protein